MPEPIPDEIDQKLQQVQSLGGKPETQDIIALLKIRLCQLERAFICIDAVDELEPSVQWQLLKILKELVTTHNTRLLLTGRGHVESGVQKHFEVAEEYSVTICASQEDIEKFVRQQIEEDYNLNPELIDDGLAKHIEDAIIEKSQGM